MKKNNIASGVLTYQDVYDLCEKLDITIYEFESYYGYRVAGKDPEAPIEKRGLDFMLRVLTAYPELCPLPKKKSFREIEDFFKQHVLFDYLKANFIPALLGITAHSYATLKNQKKTPSKAMVAAFNTISPLLVEKETEGAVALLKMTKAFEQSRQTKTTKEEEEADGES
jgi:hypothetical protein